MKWKSYAKWPDGTTSDDTHDTMIQADVVCRMLRRDGLGGDGKVFPIRTWTRPDTMERNPAKVSE